MDNKQCSSGLESITRAISTVILLFLVVSPCQSRVCSFPGEVLVQKLSLLTNPRRNKREAVRFFAPGHVAGLSISPYLKQMWVFLLIVVVGTGCEGQLEDNGGPSRMFKPPFPATTVEVTPKFKVVSQRGPLSISTGISFPIELELDSEPSAIRELDEPDNDQQEQRMPERLDKASIHAAMHNRIMNKKLKIKKVRYPSKFDTNASTNDLKQARSADGSGVTGGNGISLVDVGVRESRSVHSHIPRAVQERLQLFRSVALSLNRVGFGGERCLLRAICEAAKFPQADEEGLVGQIVTLLLTVPENTIREMANYNEATEHGKTGKDCVKHYKDCPFSVFSVVNI